MKSAIKRGSTFTNVQYISGYCLYGDDPGCAFQCQCAVDSECSGGTCPSGCGTAPLGYNWRGPACQIRKSSNVE